MNKFISILLLLIPMVGQAQYGYITGKVFDKFGPVSGAAVNIEGSQYATYTNEAGYFAFEIDTGFHEISVNITGYHQLEKAIILLNLEQKELDFELESSLMDADVSVGTKSNVAQNQLESAVPIDVIYGEELVNSGQTELSHALHFLLPNFYSVRQSTADGTDMVDPISLRGLGPDQILVLVNGKRRHKSSLLNLSDVFGKGTASTDLNAIPINAIDRIEILRDGASSQYGSDAIAGVMNIVLKSQSSDAGIIVQGGSTLEGDGELTNVGFNYGFNIKRRGYFNIAGNLVSQNAVNRAGEYTGVIFGDSRDLDETARNEFFDQTGFPNNTIAEIGSAENTNTALFYNTQLELTDNMDWYSFGGVSYKEGTIKSVYRFPANVEQVVDTIYPNGFAPNIEPKIFDRSFVTGIRGNVNDWFLDFSYNKAINTYDISVNNSNNASLGVLSPIEAFVGAYNYGHDILSFDATRPFELPDDSQIDLSFGVEYRVEEYKIIEGEEESYIDGNAFDTLTMSNITREPGVQGYFGVTDGDALEELRSNASVYMEMEYIKDKLLLSSAVRYESYSDFGENINYKVAGRYKFANQFLIRASHSTGFKAPSLHQLYFQKVSAVITEEGLENVGLINSENPITNSRLGILGLNPEISESYSVGITSAINRNLSFSVDAYRTNIDDRIGLVSRVDLSSIPLLSNLLTGYDIRFIELFTNLVDTETRGLDAVLAAQFNYPGYSLNINSGFSVMQTRLRGDVKEIFDELIVGEIELLDRADIARIETYVPETQWRTTATVKFNRFIVALHHTRFGRTKYVHPEDGDSNNWLLNENSGEVESRDQVFDAKNIFSADVTASLTNKLTLTLGGINLTNQYPDKINHSESIIFGVNEYSPNVRPFDLRGTYLYGSLRMKF
ncbi:MAG: TonB-dependent receptor [bacterium]|nr:TonB-dependent receptor [bacterium]